MNKREVNRPEKLLGFRNLFFLSSILLHREDMKILRFFSFRKELMSMLKVIREIIYSYITSVYINLSFICDKNHFKTLLSFHR